MGTSLKINSNSAGSGTVVIQAAQGSSTTTLNAPASNGTIATTDQIPSITGLISKTGSRGTLAGFDTLVTGNTVSASSPDSQISNGNITVNNGAAATQWTKTIAVPSVVTITLGSSWSWVGGSAPEVKANSVLILSWQGSFGLANLVSP